MDEFMMRFHELEEDEYGIGVVEVVLIITVSVGLVLLFKNQITDIVKTLLTKMNKEAKQL